MPRKDYEKPAMRVVEIRQHGMLMTSNPEPVSSGNSINDWKDGGTDTENIYM